MQNTIIYLIGHYGVGKLTVARAICARTGARLFDNHLVNNVIFSLVRVDGRTMLPGGVWDHVWNVRTEAVKAIEALAPAEFSFVLTNALKQGDAMDRDAYEQIVSLAAARSAIFVPVLLNCAEAEHARRVTGADREAGLKTTDAEHAIDVRRRTELLAVVHPNRLDLDNTDLSPDEAADRIISHAESCAR